PSSSASAATSPETSAQAQARHAVSRRACAFFSPCLTPVVERGTGPADPVVSPEMPTRRAGGPAGLAHAAHRQSAPPGGLMTARWGPSTEVGVQGLAPLRPGMLRLRDAQMPATPPVAKPELGQPPRGPP